MKNQMIRMLTLQDTMNTKVHSDWINQGYAWHRAIWVECAELLDHYGWKWWKAQQADIAQVQLELVDIWHFVLSLYLVKNQNSNIENTADQILALWQQGADSNSMKLERFSSESFRGTLEALVAALLSEKRFDFGLFAQLLQSVDMDFTDLFAQYVNKNVLNIFRQDHGYQDGSYIKQWDGLEDNEQLAILAGTLDASDDGYQDKLYNALEQKYVKIIELSN